MTDVCKNCKLWRKQKYWNELPSNKHHFFKIMLGDFRNHLRVPKKFMNNFRGEMLKDQVITLKGPSGDTWKMEIIQTEDDFFLQNGWEIFAMDHGLNDGDFLVFRYLKDSTFEVLIFDPSGCEKESCHFVERNWNKRAKLNCCSMREQMDDLENVSESSQELIQSEDDDDLQFKEKKGVIQSDENRNRNFPGTFKTDNKPHSYPMYYISKRRAITAEERKRAYDSASRHAPKRPSCKMIKMKPSHVTHGFTLTIPREFAENYLQNESQGIQLRVPPKHKTWDIQLLVRKQQQYTFSKGWSDFVLDNNLEEDDYCVLELANKGTEKKKTLLDVFIFRVVEEIVPLEKFKP